MSATTTAASEKPARSTSHGLGRRVRTLVTVVAVLVVLVAIALGTKVVSNNSTLGSGPQKFSAATFGKDEFPKVQAAVSKRAVPAATLAAALKSGQDAALKKYGVAVPGGVGPEVSVSFSGKAGKGDSGIYPITVAGLDKKIVLRVQTGPAINGTDLRDATGTITFGQFTNQIDYQNAASALNQELKKEVLTKLGTGSLTGKTLTGTGVFQFINPQGWLITPTKLSAS